MIDNDISLMSKRLEINKDATTLLAGDFFHNQKSDGLLRRLDAARRTHTIKYQLVIAVIEQKINLSIYLGHFPQFGG